MNKDTNIETKLNEYKLGVMDALQKGTFDSRVVDAVTAIMNVDSKASFEKLEKEILVGSLANPFVDCVLKDIVNILEIKDLYDDTISKVAEDFKTQQVAEQIQLSKFMEEYIELNKDSTFEQLKLNITDDIKSEPIDVFKMGYALSKVKPAPKLYGVVANYINENKEVVYCDVISITAVSDQLAKEIYATEYTAIAKYMHDNHLDNWANNNDSVTFNINNEIIQSMLKTLAPFLLRNKIEAPLKSALSTVLEHGISRNGLYNVEYTVSAIYDYDKIDTMSEMYLAMYYHKLLEIKSKNLHEVYSYNANYEFYMNRKHKNFDEIAEDLRLDTSPPTSESELAEFKSLFGEIHSVDLLLTKMSTVVGSFRRLLPDVVWCLNTNVRNGNNTIIAVEKSFLMQYLDYYKAKSSFPYIVSKDKYPTAIFENMIF